MTVHTGYTNTIYSTDGVGPYTFPWPVATQSYVLVAISGVILEEGVGYTAELNADRMGGSITLGEEPEVGLELQIARYTLTTQALELPAYTRFPSKANEAALDRLTLIVQEHEARLDNLFSKIPQSEYSNVVGGVFVTTT